MPEVKYKVDLPAFTGRNVPIKEIAKAIGKDSVCKSWYSARGSQIWCSNKDGRFKRIQLLLPR